MHGCTTLRASSVLNKKYLQFIFSLSTAFLIIASSRAARADRVVDYQYPYRDPSISTATYALLKGGHAPRSRIQLEFIPSRNRVPQLEREGKIEVQLYRQRKPASLIVVVPGLGGEPESGGPRYIAEFLYGMGYHVLVLPSPMHWRFILAASHNGAAGITEADAKDLYTVIQAALKESRRKLRTEIKDIGLLGWSLGGLESAFLAKLDEEKKQIGFKRTLIINPPWNMLFGAQSLDNLKAVGDHWPDSRKQKVLFRAYATVRALLTRDMNDPSYFDGLDRLLKLSIDELQFVMGSYFHSTIGEAMFTSQQVNDRGILPSRNLYDRNRQDEAKLYSFIDYIGLVALPLWRELRGSSSSLGELNQSSSLDAVQTWLGSARSVFILHNEDDFLLQPGDVDRIEATFGSRATIYPYGGHMGNIWYKDNQARIAQLLRAGLN